MMNGSHERSRDGIEGKAKQLLLGIKLRDAATFSNYRGKAKEVLINQLSCTDDKLWFTYVWGAKGTGRSHLLQAACRFAQLRNMRTACFSLDTIGTTDALQNVAELDLVCLDNLESIAGSEEWEELLLHLINDLRDKGHRLIISNNTPPIKTSIKLPDLKSRLLAALPVETDNLNDDEKLEVLKMRADARGFQLTADSGRFILQRSSRELSHLINALDDLDEQSVRHQKKLTIPFIKTVLNI